MAHALALGRRGLGHVWPWPSVGCVIVKDGRVLGRGTTDRLATYRHAEIVALSQATGEPRWTVERKPAPRRAAYAAPIVPQPIP